MPSPLGSYRGRRFHFLWVLELAALWKLFGLRPENAAPWLSVACTVGTLAATVWWAMRLPGQRHRALVTWMALGLLCLRGGRYRATLNWSAPDGSGGAARVSDAQPRTPASSTSWRRLTGKFCSRCWTAVASTATNGSP